ARRTSPAIAVEDFVRLRCIDKSHCFSYIMEHKSRSRKDQLRRHTVVGSEGGARGRFCRPHPGSFGHQSLGTTDQAARCSLGGDRRRRVTPAKPVSVLPQEWGST